MPVVQRIPRRLEELLGADGTDQFVDFLNGALQVHKEDIITTVVDKFERRVVAETSALRVQIAELRAEVKTKIAELRTEVKTEIAAVRTEMADKFEKVHREIGGIHAAIAGQTRWLVVLGLALVTLYPLINRLLEKLF
ncbi:MAG: hypothetical protein HS115_15330 [Spirochaetales bacterium]|nr:hypothetical protein [Spirochaetales bacterium]